MTTPKTHSAMQKLAPLAIAAAGLLAVGCADLAENPISGITASYYATPPGFDAAVNASYTPLRDWYGQQMGMTFTTFGTDEFTNGSDGSYKHFNTYTTQLNGDDSYIRDFWRLTYRAVNTTNTVLDAAPTANVPDATKKVRVAEAKFLRALYFFNAVRTWGDIPMPLKATEGPQTEATREPVAKVYDQIVKDLTEAAADLPPSQPQYGRATKYAAQQLLMTVYLTRAASGDFQKAADLGKGIINSGAFSLLPKYSDLWVMSNERNSEIIWSVQFTPDLLTTGPGNSSHLYHTMAYDLEAGMVRDIANGRPFRRFRATTWMYGNFDRSKDTRYEDSFTSAYISNNPNNIPKDASGKPRWSVGDTAFYLSPVEVDAAERAKHSYVIYAPSQYTEARFPSFNKKFIDPLRALVNDTTGSRDWFVMRLADTYLQTAEALIRDGKNAEAVPFINTVRERAAKPGVAKSSMDITAGEATLDFLLDERARELGAEMTRWFDLVRTGKLIERVQKYNPQAAPNIKPTHLLRPIPNEQITLTSNKFPQNPGY
ncbi:RagB/SusD domain-containing protein (plasmid) [Gemmatirosa kalamazoonensis]|uniref:RagB/SusD domain-containing protein n=1 Tax=Gemmatirosa kalamazoonensis TaxID=861299 RepID=W0RQ60_9BACT|nr:RagB/SusD family nutrient uptake outer membrane protein [Gemmatirosa kalamazoonensis]AHG93134.1 RagB/SusD domain-containing protein [Gemmatirosa kalamazoonensis]